MQNKSAILLSAVVLATSAHAKIEYAIPDSASVAEYKKYIDEMNQQRLDVSASGKSNISSAPIELDDMGAAQVGGVYDSRNLGMGGQNDFDAQLMQKMQAPRVQKDVYDEEVIYNYHLLRKQAGIKSPTNVANLGQLVPVKSAAELAPKTAAAAPVKPVRVYGYCFTPVTVNVNFAPMAATLSCSTNIGAITFNGNYVPANEIHTLFVAGLSIEKFNQKYKILNARILNEARNSYNVATYVNSNRIEKAWLDAGVLAADEVNTGVNDYMSKLIASRTKEEINYINNNYITDANGNVVPIANTPIKTTTSEKPVVNDYLITSGINILAGTAKEILKAFKDELPFAYQVVARSQFYVDLYVDPKPMDIDSSKLNNMFNYKDGKGRVTDGDMDKRPAASGVISNSGLRPAVPQTAIQPTSSLTQTYK